VPYLQLDLPGRFESGVKRDLAARLGALYAEVMQTRPSMVNVGFRELGPDNLYRCDEDGPTPVVMVMCDVRRGRPADQRLRLAEGIMAACTETFGIPAEQVVIEFTQHAADEMYRSAGWGTEWDAAEAT